MAGTSVTSNVGLAQPLVLNTELPATNRLS
jgi:hypothetical protein